MLSPFLMTNCKSEGEIDRQARCVNVSSLSCWMVRRTGQGFGRLQPSVFLLLWELSKTNNPVLQSTIECGALLYKNISSTSKTGSYKMLVE